MARIRTIKPEFWCDEKLSPLTPTDRLVFLGLISMADDYGRVHDNVKIIDAFVFPNTSDTVRESLANLSRIIRINRGISSSGMPIIEIVNWDKHQRVDKPQPKLALPVIVKDNNGKPTKTKRKHSIREPVANDSGTVRELVAPLTTDPDHRPPTTDQRPSNGHVSISKKSKVEKPDEVTQQHWDDWLAIRKKKPTQTAMDAMYREAALAGISIGEAVKIAAERSWQGFKAEWLEAAQNGSGRYGKKPIDLDTFIIK